MWGRIRHGAKPADTIRIEHFKYRFSRRKILYRPTLHILILVILKYIAYIIYFVWNLFLISCFSAGEYSLWHRTTLVYRETVQLLCGNYIYFLSLQDSNNLEQSSCVTLRVASVPGIAFLFTPPSQATLSVTEKPCVVAWLNAWMRQVERLP